MVKMYTRTVCPKCMAAKAFFAGNGVDVETINTDNDLAAREKLIDEGFMAVPIVEHDGKYYQNMGEFQELVDTLQ